MLALASVGSTANAAIVLNAGGPYLLSTSGSPVVLDGSGSFSTTPGAVQYRWDFGNGSNTGWLDTAKVTTNYNFLDGQLFIATLFGRYAADPADVVSAIAVLTTATHPVANAGGPYTLTLGSSVTLNGGRSSSPFFSDPLAYAWDLDGDGLFDDASTATVDFAPRPDTQVVGGVYAVALRVTDLTNGFVSSAYDTTVTVVAPLSTGVPEPETWALMVGGFGLAGAALRRRLAGARPTA